VPSERRARSAWLIAAVAAGGVTFFALANRPKDEKKATDPAENSATEDQVDQASQVAVRQQLEEYEVQWLMSLIASEAPTPTRPVSELPQRVGDARLGHSWEMVNALRLAGRFNQARSLSQTLSIEDGTLSLALLDLAEAPEAPPWPLIIKRLIEAAALDKEPFVAKSALVYSLAKSGDLARARSELERLQASSTSNGPAATGSRAPLAEPLSLWLDALDPTDPGKTNGSVGTPQLPAQAAARQLDEPIATDNSQTAATEKQESDTKRADVTSDASNDTAEQPPTDQDKTESKPQKVRPEVEAKVTRADMLWRGGNRDAALKLYREVVAEIGTTHFLGQRSAARIRRAEKEQAGAQ
jgi:hypothetical protein